jgi:hypothetical protein
VIFRTFRLLLSVGTTWMMLEFELVFTNLLNPVHRSLKSNVTTDDWVVHTELLHVVSQLY